MIIDIAVDERPVKSIAKPRFCKARLKKLPTALNADDKSGSAADIAKSIGLSKIDTKPIIKLIIPFKIAFIINLTPQFHLYLGL